MNLTCRQIISQFFKLLYGLAIIFNAHCAAKKSTSDGEVKEETAAPPSESQKTQEFFGENTNEQNRYLEIYKMRTELTDAWLNTTFDSENQSFKILHKDNDFVLVSRSVENQRLAAVIIGETMYESGQELPCSAYPLFESLMAAKETATVGRCTIAKSIATQATDLYARISELLDRNNFQRSALTLVSGSGSDSSVSFLVAYAAQNIASHKVKLYLQNETQIGLSRVATQQIHAKVKDVIFYK